MPDSLAVDALRLLEYDQVRDLVHAYSLTTLGRERARVLCPLGTREELQLELGLTREMFRLVEANESPGLADLGDVPALLREVHEHGRPLSPAALRVISSALLTVTSLQADFMRRIDRFPLLAHRVDVAIDGQEMIDQIQENIDARGVVRDYASPKLTRIRQALMGFRDSIRRRIEMLLRTPRWAKAVQNPRPSVRGDRYVLAVKAESRGRVGGIVHDRSQTGSTFYVEPQELVEPQNELTELRVAEDREISRILWELTRLVLSNEADVEASMSVLAHLDLLQAKARWAGDYGMVVPDLGDDDFRLHLKNARHPLLLRKALDQTKAEPAGEGDLDAALSQVVPLTVRLGEDFGRLVITGPNTGGKTVALKTIGLLALMAQTGLPVPCDPGSVLPYLDAILVDIGDEQSLEQSLSTFSAHISKIGRIIEEATPRSLVLLDELGAGTDPLEGGALATAILEKLQGGDIPAVITTHLGALKEFAYSNPGAENASVEFDRESLGPTFRLLIGQAGNSNAVLIARRLGMPASICDRASDLLAVKDQRAEALIESMQESRMVLERQRQQAEDFKDETRLAKDQASQELEQLQDERDTVSREADQEIDRVLRRMQEALAPVVSKIKNAPKPFNRIAEELSLILDGELERSPLDQKRRDYARGLKKEDPVYLPKYKKKGRVLKVDRKHEVVSVKIGALSVEVPFSEVSWIEVDHS